jgi:dihydroorotate dehydrogenase (fumarate)
MGALQLISPPLVNSANPWATTIEQLKELYLSPFTGAITTRTCTLNGFAHDDTIHQFAFFETASLDLVSNENGRNPPSSSLYTIAGVASLNTLGYSPISLFDTLKSIELILENLSSEQLEKRKPVIVSITGSIEELTKCIGIIETQQRILSIPLFVEINLSCPNIPNKPPPAFSKAGLLEYLDALHDFLVEPVTGHGTTYLPLRFGIKTPPYSNPDNFTTLRDALLQSCKDGRAGSGALPISFITATNTLGCSLLPNPLAHDKPHLGSADGMGIGGLAGAALHPISLGNVRLLRTMLDSDDSLRQVEIIGVGGVSDGSGFQRMKAAGATVVGVGTALGARGVQIFAEVLGKREEK